MFLIYAALNVHIILKDIFGVQLQTQLTHVLALSIILVQLYKYILIWAVNDKEKALSIYHEKLSTFTSLNNLPTCAIKKYLLPLFMEAITLKSIPQTLGFFVATNLIISFVSLFLNNVAVRWITLHLGFALYTHYKINPKWYNANLQKVEKVVKDKWDSVNYKLQRKQY